MAKAKKADPGKSDWNDWNEFVSKEIMKQEKKKSTSKSTTKKGK